MEFVPIQSFLFKFILLDRYENFVYLIAYFPFIFLLTHFPSDLFEGVLNWANKVQMQTSFFIHQKCIAQHLAEEMSENSCFTYAIVLYTTKLCRKYTKTGIRRLFSAIDMYYKLNGIYIKWHLYSLKK